MSDIEVTFRDSDGGEVAIRQIALGLTPCVLIEPEYDEATDSATFNIDVTDLDREGLATVLRLLADSLADATTPDPNDEPGARAEGESL